MMLNFEPKYHTQIAEGRFAGSWVAKAMLPAPFHFASHNHDAFALECQAESARIQAKGGAIIIFDPKGDSNMAGVMGDFIDKTS